MATQRNVSRPRVVVNARLTEPSQRRPSRIAVVCSAWVNIRTAGLHANEGNSVTLPLLNPEAPSSQVDFVTHRRQAGHDQASRCLHVLARCSLCLQSDHLFELLRVPPLSSSEPSSWPPTGLGPAPSPRPGSCSIEPISASITSSMVTIPAAQPYSSITKTSCRRLLRIRSMSRSAGSVCGPPTLGAGRHPPRVTGTRTGSLASL